MSDMNSQALGRVSDQDGRPSGTDGESVVAEQLIAHVLGQAHRTALVQDAPNEARAILQVAQSFADELAQTDPRFDRVRFIEAATESQS